LKGFKFAWLLLFPFFLSFLTPFIPWHSAAATWYDDYDGGGRWFIFQKQSKEDQEEDANVSGV